MKFVAKSDQALSALAAEILGWTYPPKEKREPLSIMGKGEPACYLGPGCQFVSDADAWNPLSNVGQAEVVARSVPGYKSHDVTMSLGWYLASVTCDRHCSGVSCTTIEWARCSSHARALTIASILAAGKHPYMDFQE